jgi:hypothetical protein
MTSTFSLKRNLILTPCFPKGILSFVRNFKPLGLISMISPSALPVLTGNCLL